MKDIGPILAPSMGRQRKSHFHKHLLPRFGSMAVVGIDIQLLQQFVSDASNSLSCKTILNILGTFNEVLDYANKTSRQTPSKCRGITMAQKPPISNEQMLQSCSGNYANHIGHVLSGLGYGASCRRSAWTKSARFGFGAVAGLVPAAGR
jgi:hypothetical protein